MRADAHPLLGGCLMSNERNYDTERLPDTNSSNLAENLDRRNFLKTAVGGSAAVAMTLAGTVGSAGAAARVPAKDLPVDENIGDLEAVASFSQQVVGVAVSASGRVFVSFPRNGIDTVKISVAEVINGSRPGNGEGFVKAVAYPNAEINRLDTTAPSTHFLSAQSVYVDSSDTLWVLDVGNLGSGTALISGGAKLVAIDLTTNAVKRTIVFPASLITKGTSINDVRFDLARGAAGFAYIPNSSAPAGTGLTVVDLSSSTGALWRENCNHVVTHTVFAATLK